MEKIFCEKCKEEIELQPCYIGGKTICGKCYISEKFKNSHQQIYEKKLREAEERAKRKKTEIKKKKRLKNKRLQRKKDIENKKTKSVHKNIIIAKRKKQKRPLAPKPKQKKCKNCGIKFLPERNNKRYKFCSKKCFWVYYYLNIFLNKCPKCGKKKKRSSKLCHDCSNKSRPRSSKTGRFTCIS